MSETVVDAASTTKMVNKPKKVATHPKYSEMVQQAIGSLKERGGSSRQAILKHITTTFSIGADEKVVNQHLKMALRAGAKNNSLKQFKGTGAAGSFRIGEEAKTEETKKKKALTKVKKPKAAIKTPTKNPKTTKKTADATKPKATKPKAKKDKSPKKTTKTTQVKKPAREKPTKAATPKPKKADAKPKKAVPKPAKKPTTKAKKPVDKIKKDAASKK